MWYLPPVLKAEPHMERGIAMKGGEDVFYPGVLIWGMVIRKPSYYIWNVVVPMAAFSLSAILTHFAFDHSDGVGDRLGVTLTLVGIEYTKTPRSPSKGPRQAVLCYAAGAAPVDRVSKWVDR